MNRAVKEFLLEIPPASVISCKRKSFSLFGLVQLWWARVKEGVAGCATHTALYVGGGHNYIIEATVRGVRKTKLKKYVGNKNYQVDIFAKKNLTVVQAEQIKAFAYSKIGKGYDFRGILRFVFRRLPDNPNRFHCAEVTCDSCWAGKWRISPKKCYNSSPSVVEDFLGKQKKVDLVYTQH